MSYQNIDKSYESGAGYTATSQQTSTNSSSAFPENPYSNSSGGSVSANFFSTTSVTESKSILRIAQLLVELISFSCVAAAVEWAGTPESWNTFLIFVGVTAFIMDIGFVIIYTYSDSLPASWEARLPMVDLIVTALWALFWFCGSVAYAASLNKLASELPVLPGLSTGRAGAAFGFFAWLLWTASAFLSFQRYKASGASLGSLGSSGGAAPVHYNDL